MVTKRKGRRYIKMLSRGVVKPYIMPARGLVIEDIFGELTLLLEDILFFPEMFAFIKVTDNYIYDNIRFEFAPRVLGHIAPIVKCRIDTVLEATKYEEVKLVRNSLLDIKVGYCSDF